MAEGEGNWLNDMQNAAAAEKEKEEFVWTLLTPEEKQEATKTVRDQYGVNIASNNTVDLDATLNDIRSLLAKSNTTVSDYSAKAIENFSRDLLALRESHQTYMDKLAEQTVKAPEINWAERTQVLKQKARADYMTENAGKVGRMETIITSPLLDETDPVTTKNILGGS
jgi:hypothetical protein